MLVAARPVIFKKLAVVIDSVKPAKLADKRPGTANKRLKTVTVAKFGFNCFLDLRL